MIFQHIFLNCSFLEQSNNVFINFFCSMVKKSYVIMLIMCVFNVAHFLLLLYVYVYIYIFV